MAEPQIAPRGVARTIWKKLGIAAANDGCRKSDGRIEIGAWTAEGLSDKHAAKNGDGPAGGDNHPASVCCKGAAKGNACADSVAEKDQDKRSDKLAKPNGMHVFFRTRWTGQEH